MTTRQKLKELGLDYHKIAEFFSYSSATFANSTRRELIEKGVLRVVEYIQASNESKAKAKGSVSVDIVDSDIATIEALHDLLLDAHGYSLDFITLKRARELTTKMYKAFE